MKWLIVYLLIGVLVTTISVKLLLDDEAGSKKMAGYFQKSAPSVIAAYMVIAAFWPLILIYSLGGRYDSKPK